MNKERKYIFSEKSPQPQSLFGWKLSAEPVDMNTFRLAPVEWSFPPEAVSGDTQLEYFEASLKKFYWKKILFPSGRIFSAWSRQLRQQVSKFLSFIGKNMEISVRRNFISVERSFRLAVNFVSCPWFDLSYHGLNRGSLGHAHWQ